jgi:hypothetical protein
MEIESEFFSGRVPILVNDEFATKMEDMLKIEEYTGPSLNNTLKWIYTEYISPNIFALIIILCVLFFLYIRWILTKQKSKPIIRKNKNKKENRRVILTGDGIAYVYDDKRGTYAPVKIPTAPINKTIGAVENDNDNDDYSMTDEDLETDEPPNNDFDDRNSMDRIAQRTFAGSYIDRNN